MDTRCEYSVLTLPNDPSYVAVARRYVGEVSKKMGFDDDEQDAIDRAVFEAVENVVEHAFEPGEKESFSISCERVPVGLRIVVKETGQPFDPDIHLDADGTGENSRGPDEKHGIPLMRALMDEISVHNLGREGKEVRLTKYLKSATIEDYVAACDLGPYEPPAAVRPRIDEKRDFHVRLMKPEEAVEVAKCAYKSYGYSYFYPAIYYPERMVELNRSGLVVSAVAVTEDGELAGHTSLVRADVHSPLAEVAQGLVKPEYRGQGCFVKLAEFILAEGTSRGLTGMFMGAVTNHSFSQRVAERFGFHNCGLRLGYAPATVSFRGISDRLSQRETFTIDYKYLHAPDGPLLHPPPHHRDFIAKLYGNLGVNPRMTEPGSCRVDYPEAGASLEIKAGTFMPEGFAAMEVKRYGKDIVSQVRRRLKDLCLQRYEVIELGLDLADPFTCRLTEEFEQLGFFFGGILPGASGRETLLLHYLNNTVIDYEKIHLHSDLGKETLAYVREHDPNWRT